VDSLIKSKRILITGGFGFIGSRLSQRLTISGYKVVLGSRKARETVDCMPEIEVVRIDWDDNFLLRQKCVGFDVVINAAGMNSQECESNPLAAFEFNGLATGRLLKAAISAGVKRFIQLSTVHVYSNPLQGEITEETCPRNLHPYATSNVAGENFILAANNQGLIDGLVLRLSNSFGAPLNKNANCWMLLINDLCKQATISRKIIIKSSGLQQRDFISVGEVCRAIELLCSYDTKKKYIFNLCSGLSTPVFEIAKFIQERCQVVLGFKPDLYFEGYKNNEKNNHLHIRPINLEKLGIQINHDMTNEIDNLLKFCCANFEST
jgi:UDP-glucose 4-epimerase